MKGWSYLEKDKTTITILYTSDVHGHAMPIIYGTNEPADLGLAKYATAVKNTRKMNEHVIVLDNGDLIQGTPLMTHYVKDYADHRTNPMIGIMNHIGIDAGVIGNHEFNFGKNILKDAVAQSHFPWISANILDEQTNRPYFGPPYLMKTLKNGVKLAVIGVTTHYIPNWESPAHIEGIRFTDACQTLHTWVHYIQKNEQPDILIAAYHGGLERDAKTGAATEKLTGENQGYQMCATIPGIDILLTGHQHRVLTETINDVLVIQPGHNGKMYGEITIDLKKRGTSWTIVEKKAAIHTLEGVEADNEIMAYMQGFEASTQTWLVQPIGYIEGDMTITDPFAARVKKHPFIELIQTVQMDASGADISVTALLNNDSRGFSPVVTMRDIVANYIYPNTLVVLALTGKDIREALEKSAEYFVLDKNGEITVNPIYETPKPQHYNYDMWEGIYYTIDVSRPFGARVEHITYHNQALEDDKTYHVVVNNYRASGGGDYDMFKNKPVIKEIQTDMVDLIRHYFEKHGTVRAVTTKNFTVKA